MFSNGVRGPVGFNDGPAHFACAYMQAEIMCCQIVPKRGAERVACHETLKVIYDECVFSNVKQTAASKTIVSCVSAYALNCQCFAI